MHELVAAEAGSCPVLIVTGTNGKGSTVAITAYILQQAGLRVGVIASPALRADQTDMIQVNGAPIGYQEFARLIDEVRPLLDRLDCRPGTLTHYMPICLAAYRHFTEYHVDVVVAETAMGGAYDPTAPPGPKACAFTNIEEDHLDVFGRSHYAICRNKCRIIGEGSMVLMGTAVNPRMAETVASYAMRRGAWVVSDTGSRTQSVDTDTLFDNGRLRITDRHGWSPEYQKPNIRLAGELASTILPTAGRAMQIDVRAAGPRFFPPNRFERLEYHGLTVVFDSAHNDAGYRALLDSIKRSNVPRPIHILKGFLDAGSVEVFESYFDRPSDGRRAWNRL